MASDKVFVDLDEEIVFTVEKITNASSKRVIVVIPESANLVASLVSLKLLSSQISRSPKSIVIVTEDSLGLKLSKKAGLLAKEKISHITPNVWVEAEELKEKFKEERDKRKNELIAQRNETTDYKILDTKKEEREEQPQEARIEEPTEEDQNKPAGEQEKLENQEKIDYTPAIAKKPRLDAKIINLGNIKVLAGGDITQNSDLKMQIEGIEPTEAKSDKQPAQEQDNLPKQEVEVQKDKKETDTQEDQPDYSSKRTSSITKAPGPASNLIGRDLAAIVPAARNSRRNKFQNQSAPMEFEPSKRSLGHTPDMGKLSLADKFYRLKSQIVDFYKTGNTKVKIGATVAVFLGLIFVLSSSTFASAKVDIYVKTQNVSIDQVVQAKQGAILDPTIMTIPVRQVKLTESSTNSADTTGRVEDGAKAQGLITIYNKTEQDINLAAGSIVENINNGLRYTILNAATVPAAVIDGGGNLNLGVKKDVSIQAEKFGENYNTTATASYKIASYTTDQLTAKSFNNIEGGNTSDERAVAESDINTLSSALTEELKNTLTREIESQVAKDREILIPGSISFGSPVSSSDKKVKEKADGVSVTVEMEATGYIVALDELKELVAGIMKEKSEFEGEVDASKLAVPTLSNVVIEGETITFNITSTGDVTAGFTQSELKKELAGKSRKDAENYLKSQEAIEKYELSIGPFYLPSFIKKMPNENKIEINIEAVKE